jgi:REP element-mobilizing transposase RayT
MGTYTQILYQVVFSTKYREQTMQENEQEQLYKYISGILKNKKCHLYRINATENHIHIVTYIHPSISPASLVKDIKLASSLWIKESGIFKNFNGWQDGYGAFTYSVKEKERLINYVKNQKEHHKVKTFIEEYVELLKEHEIDYDEKYLL